MASAEPYARYLHFAPEDNHASTSSVRYFAGWMPFLHPINSVKALKAKGTLVNKKPLVLILNLQHTAILQDHMKLTYINKSIIDDLIPMNMKTKVR